MAPLPVRAILRRYAPDVEPLRVAVLGFSESCTGVREMLSSGDGNRFDAAVAIDGIHAPYSSPGVPNPLYMKSWLALGQKAYEHRALCLITHSSVVPPNYASTTETANYIWTTLTGTPGAAVQPPVPPLTWPSYTVQVRGPVEQVGPARDVSYPVPALQPAKRLNGLFILGFNNLDPRGTADHIYQAKVVLPVMLGQILAPRWNDIDPSNPGATCYIA